MRLAWQAGKNSYKACLTLLEALTAKQTKEQVYDSHYSILSLRLHNRRYFFTMCVYEYMALCFSLPCH
jgi:hypothetical protein